MLFRWILAAIILIVGINHTTAQSVELYGGTERSGVDLMWFRYLKHKENQSTPFLFSVETVRVQDIKPVAL